MVVTFNVIICSKFQVNEEEASLLDMLWLLLASVIFVPTFQKLPGGEYVLHAFLYSLSFLPACMLAIFFLNVLRLTALKFLVY